MQIRKYYFVSAKLFFLLFVTISSLVFLQKYLPIKYNPIFRISIFFGVLEILFLSFYQDFTKFYTFAKKSLLSLLYFSYLIFFLSYTNIIEPNKKSVIFFVSSFLIFVYFNTKIKIENAHNIINQEDIFGYFGFPKKENKELEMVCAHEAGHALFYAAVHRERIHRYFFVYAEKKIGKKSVGYTRAILFEPKQETDKKSDMEWKMLMLLAGHLAEDFLYHDEMLGGFSDIHAWMDCAVRYLCGSTSNGFILSEKIKNILNDIDKTTIDDFNKSVIKNLLEKQRAMVYDFLSQNKEVLIDLASDLKKNKKIFKKDLEKYWDRVQYPEDFPKPFHFSSQ